MIVPGPKMIRRESRPIPLLGDTPRCGPKAKPAKSNANCHS
jgi:hypothetical protein